LNGLGVSGEDGVEGLTEGVAVVKGMPKQEHAQAVRVVAAAHMEGKVAAARFAGGGGSWRGRRWHGFRGLGLLLALRESRFRGWRRRAIASWVER